MIETCMNLKASNNASREQKLKVPCEKSNKMNLNVIGYILMNQCCWIVKLKLFSAKLTETIFDDYVTM